MTDRLLETLGAITATAADTAERVDEVVELLRRIGVDVDADDLAGGFPAAASIAALAAGAADLLDGLTDGADAADVAAGAELAEDVAAVVDEITSSGLALPDAPDLDWGEVAISLPQVLLFDAIEDGAPWLLAALLLLGIVEEQIHEIDDEFHRSVTVNTEGLGDLVVRPADHFRSLFVDGDRVDLARCTRALELLLGGDLVVDRRAPSADWTTAFLGGRLDPTTPGEDPRTVTVVRSRGVTLARPLRALGASVGPARPGNDADAEATALGLRLDGIGGGEVSVPVADGVTMTISTAAPSPGLIIADDGTIDATSAVTGDVVRVTVSGSRDEGWTLLGRVGATRVSVAGFELTLTAGGTPLDLAAELSLSELALELGGGDADSFIADLLGAFTVPVDLDLGLSGGGGLVLGGAPRLDIVIPLSLRLGPVELSDVGIAIAPQPAGVDLTLTTGVSAALGPFAFVVDGIGAVMSAKSGGIGFGFQPPSAIGVSVDAGVVSGGGLVRIADGSYSGALELAAFGVGISAIVIIDTDVPGVDGWSMLFALYLDLPSIQLGFGFTLNGVGGLGGVNRAIDVEALQAAVRSGALGAILFPEDPVTTAPQTISELQAIFPPAADSYVFGPVVKIGWGTPPIIEAELGIVIQVPAPIVLAVLGSVTAILPSEDVELVALRLDVAGVIDAGAGTLSIDASLHDSHVIGFALAGDMALRASFSDSRSFLLSLGGFHPAFDPPAGFPTLQRLSLGIDAGSVLSVSFECYFALTSNTVQFGSAFALDANVLGFGISGGASFDALIQFSPFQLTTSIGFHVSITAAGVDLAGVWLEGSLTGPNPWHVVGTATFKVLFVEQDIRIDELIGSRQSDPVPSDPGILDQLVIELERIENWVVVGTGVANGVVLTDTVAAAAGELVARPDAVLEVRQTVVPLGLRLEQFGNAPVGDQHTFTIDVGDGDLEPAGDVSEWFAVGQFLTLTPAEKLAAPSFESMLAGLRFGSDAIAADAGRSASLDHKEFTLDPELPISDPVQDTVVFTKTKRATDGISYVHHTTATAGGFHTAGETVVQLAGPSYVLTDTMTLERSDSFSSWSAARQAGAHGHTIERVSTP
jgi:uncharacterized protein DUF6603